MKRFYVIWFFFCAGWGYIMSAFRGFADDDSVYGWLAMATAGAITSFLLLSIELWRLPAGVKVLPPSFSLKPWSMPFGLPTFIFVAFLFSSVWGLAFALALMEHTAEQPVQILMLSLGGLVGLGGACYVFPSKIQRSRVA
jgi:hypothetical protein